MSDTRKTRKTSVDLPGRTVVLHKKARHRFEVIEGVSHWIPEEAADQLNALLREHFAAN